MFEALPGKDPQDGLTGLIDEFNVTLYDNYTQFLRADGLEVISLTTGSSIGMEHRGWNEPTRSSDPVPLPDMMRADSSPFCSLEQQ